MQLKKTHDAAMVLIERLYGEKPQFNYYFGYYQSVIEKMGRKKVDAFARLYALPQTGHGLSGTNYSVDGEGKSIPTAAIPSAFSRFNLLVDWVEKKTAPQMSVTVTGGNRSLPMCSYPTYPKYVSGPADKAESYKCAAGK